MLRALVDKGTGLTFPVTAALTGAGEFAGTLSKKAPLTAALTGDGVLAGTLSKKAPLTAALAGAGALSATATAAAVAYYFDDFERADNTSSLGTNWTNGSNTVGINTGGAYNATTTGWAYWNTPVPDDDMRVDITLGTLAGSSGQDVVMIALGANTTGQRAALYWVGSAETLSIRSVPTWAGTATTQASGSSTADTGDVLSLRRVGNVYTGYQNNVAVPGLTWTDSTNVVPRDSSHRLIGLGCQGTSGANYRRIAAWAGNPVAASFAGAGALTATVVDGTPTGVTDTFTRADSTTSAGPGWTNRNGVVGVSGNNAYGVTGSSWDITSNNTAMAADDAEVSITLGTFAGTGGWDYVLIMLGCDSSGRGVFSFLNAASGEVFICDNTDWSVATYTAVASVGGVSWTVGTVYKMGRVGNVYTIYLDGVSKVSWTDSGNSIPRDSSHRLVAFGTYNDGAGSRFIDSFAAI